MNSRHAIILGAVSFVLATGHALANCSDTAETYKRAVESVSTNAQSYAQCVARSEGTDDCSFRFKQVRNAQGDFEIAVSKRQRECR